MDEQLICLLSNVFDMDRSNITEDLQQHDIPNWDSLKHMDLITKIEREYEIELSMEDIIEMTSIKNILIVLGRHGIFSYA